MDPAVLSLGDFINNNNDNNDAIIHETLTTIRMNAADDEWCIVDGRNNEGQTAEPTMPLTMSIKHTPRNSTTMAITVTEAETVGLETVDGNYYNTLENRVTTVEQKLDALLSQINAIAGQCQQYIQPNTRTAPPTIMYQPAMKPITGTAVAKKNTKKDHFSFKEALLKQRQAIFQKKSRKTRTKRKNNNSPTKKNNTKQKKGVGFVGSLQRNQRFAQELALKVLNPALNPTKHFLKQREEKMTSPQSEAIAKLEQELLFIKNKLRRCPTPKIKTIIVFD